MTHACFVRWSLGGEGGLDNTPPIILYGTELYICHITCDVASHDIYIPHSLTQIVLFTLEQRISLADGASGLTELINQTRPDQIPD